MNATVQDDYRNPFTCPACDFGSIFIQKGMATVSKVDRNPFICPCCEVVYSSALSSDDVPCHLQICAHTMCLGCLKKKRREKEKEECRCGDCFKVKCTVCNVESSVGRDPVKALTLIDILLEIQTRTAQSYLVDGNVETSNLVALKCPGCKSKYTTNTRSQNTATPYLLVCGHSMCLQCVKEHRVERSACEKARRAKLMTHQLACLKCSTEMFLRNATSSDGATVREAIIWLEKKKREKEEEAQPDPGDDFKCAECRQVTPCARGFLCNDCTTKYGEQKVLCAFCAHEDAHNTHTTEKFLPLKLRLDAVRDEALLNVQSKVGKFCSVSNKVVDNYNDVLKEVEERFSDQIKSITLAPNFSVGEQIAPKIRGKAEEFEEILRNVVLPNALRNTKALEDFLKHFHMPKREIKRNEEKQTQTEKMNGENEQNKETQTEKISGKNEQNKETQTEKINGDSERGEETQTEKIEGENEGDGEIQHEKVSGEIVGNEKTKSENLSGEMVGNEEAKNEKAGGEIVGNEETKDVKVGGEMVGNEEMKNEKAGEEIVGNGETKDEKAGGESEQNEETHDGETMRKRRRVEESAVSDAKKRVGGRITRSASKTK